MEIDEKVGEALSNQLKMHNGENTIVNGNDLDEVVITAEAAETEVMTSEEPVNIAAAAAAAQADASTNEEYVNNRLSALVECETPVDDDEEEADKHCDQNLCISEPDQQVSSMQQQQPSQQNTQVVVETLVA